MSKCDDTFISTAIIIVHIGSLFGGARSLIFFGG
jgi:hypothetical protein